MVLRINGADSLLPEGERSSEVTIWKEAAQQGIAPPLLYADEKSGFLVSPYIHTPSPIDRQFEDQAYDLISRCHHLQVDVASINYARHIDQYWENIETHNKLQQTALIDQREPMREILETLINGGAEMGLCHHDPIPLNFVGDHDGLYLIDWEYAARGLLVMDYAAFALEWGIDDTSMQAHFDVTTELLEMAKTLYTYMCALWEEQKKPRF